MNWQSEATKPEGALKSNPFANFESYATASQPGLTDSPAQEAAEGCEGPKPTLPQS